jgi:hypothetical protein
VPTIEELEYRAIRKCLYEQYNGKPPLLVFEHNDGLQPFRIDHAGYVHRVKGDLSWTDEAVFLNDREENDLDAVQRVAQQELQ